MAQLIDQILSESINSESFIANILFSKPQWDINKFVADVRKEWGLDLSGNIVDDIGLAYKANDCIRVVAFVDAKFPTMKRKKLLNDKSSGMVPRK